MASNTMEIKETNGTSMEFGSLGARPKQALQKKDNIKNRPSYRTERGEHVHRLLDQANYGVKLPPIDEIHFKKSNCIGQESGNACIKGQTPRELSQDGFTNGRRSLSASLPLQRANCRGEHKRSSSAFYRKNVGNWLIPWAM